jgi:hypothetical protein
MMTLLVIPVPPVAVAMQQMDQGAREQEEVRDHPEDVRTVLLP